MGFTTQNWFGGPQPPHSMAVKGQTVTQKLPLVEVPWASGCGSLPSCPTARGPAHRGQLGGSSGSASSPTGPDKVSGTSSPHALGIQRVDRSPQSGDATPPGWGPRVLPHSERKGISEQEGGSALGRVVPSPQIDQEPLKHPLPPAPGETHASREEQLFVAGSGPSVWGGEGHERRPRPGLQRAEGSGVACDLVGLCALEKAGRGQIPQDTQAQSCPSTCPASPAIPGPLACPPWYLLSEPGYPGLCPLPRSGPQGPLPTHALRPPLKGHLLGCTGPPHLSVLFL